jgi:hypothetical protein
MGPNKYRRGMRAFLRRDGNLPGVWERVSAMMLSSNVYGSRGPVKMLDGGSVFAEKSVVELGAGGQGETASGRRFQEPPLRVAAAGMLPRTT